MAVEKRLFYLAVSPIITIFTALNLIVKLEKQESRCQPYVSFMHTV